VKKRGRAKNIIQDYEYKNIWGIRGEAIEAKQIHPEM
jgi:hypothetical protein